MPRSFASPRAPSTPACARAGSTPRAARSAVGRRPPPEFRSTLPPPPPGRTSTAAWERRGRRRVCEWRGGGWRGLARGRHATHGSRLAILRAGNPLGCSPQLRALWRWRAFAGGEYRQAVIEEARRLRGERDAATERERGLKRGIATLREEKAKLDDEVAAAEGEAAAPDGDAAAARRAAREVAAIKLRSATR